MHRRADPAAFEGAFVTRAGEREVLADFGVDTVGKVAACPTGIDNAIGSRARPFGKKRASPRPRAPRVVYRGPGAPSRQSGSCSRVSIRKTSSASTRGIIGQGGSFAPWLGRFHRINPDGDVRLDGAMRRRWEEVAR